MSRQRNWTAVGLGVEVLAGVAILISPWLAIPIALGGAGIIAWGLYPEKIERVISRVLPSRIPNQDADPYIPLKEAVIVAYEETRGTEASTKDGTPSIMMTVGESGPYFDTEGGTYDIRRTFNLKLENIDRSKPVSNYSVKILSVTPTTDYEGPWLLSEGLSLAAGEHVFIPLVTYGEAREPDKYPCGDTFMTMGTADGWPCLAVGKKYTVTMRATAPETAFCDFQCKIWVDDSGRLRIEGA